MIQHENMLRNKYLKKGKSIKNTQITHSLLKQNIYVKQTQTYKVEKKKKTICGPHKTTNKNIFTNTFTIIECSTVSYDVIIVNMFYYSSKI